MAVVVVMVVDMTFPCTTTAHLSRHHTPCTGSNPRQLRCGGPIETVSNICCTDRLCMLGTAWSTVSKMQRLNHSAWSQNGYG